MRRSRRQSTQIRVKSERPDDSELIRKLEKDAWRTNEEVLSDAERVRGKQLLMAAERQLNDLALGPATSRRAKQDPRVVTVTKWRATLAAQRLLPYEILREIFLFSVAPYGAPALTFPHCTTTTPWTLRSVCARWRQIVLQLKELWGRHYIKLEGHTASKVVRFFKHVIPPQGYLFMEFTGTTSREDCALAIRELVIPNLSRTYALALSKLPISALDGLLNVPAGQFSRMVKFTLVLNNPTGQEDPYLNQRLAGTQIIRSSPHLQSLVLGGFYSHSIHAPPATLSALDISGLQSFTVQEAYAMLKNVPRLQTLGISLTGPGIPNAPPILPYLHTVKLKYAVPDLAFTLPIPWRNLSHLDLKEATELGPNKLLVLLQRINAPLISLSVTVNARTDQNINPPTVIMPRLQALDIATEFGGILTFLVVRSLATLRICCNYLPASQVVDMIGRSGCRLLEFVHTKKLPPNSWSAGGEPRVISLLEAMPYLHHFIVPKIELRAQTMHRIARGTLVPHVRALEFFAFGSELDNLLDLVESRRPQPGSRLGTLYKVKVTTPYIPSKDFVHLRPFMELLSQFQRGGTHYQLEMLPKNWEKTK
ncbi:hypothetical protein H0H81_010011 [Sphagnurus paluster]|uniref:F-box domain-containing protein n=1 Tax=Sphagnurus paluster TaxID=117069 RepID=A0A9P7FRT2_9AGAR|nr:hypothetical protein H0H81_010011 [Sphagnurus paluster]